MPIVPAEVAAEVGICAVSCVFVRTCQLEAPDILFGRAQFAYPKRVIICPKSASWILKTRISVFFGFPEFLRIFEVSGKMFFFVYNPILRKMAAAMAMK